MKCDGLKVLHTVIFNSETVKGTDRSLTKFFVTLLNTIFFGLLLLFCLIFLYCLKQSDDIIEIDGNHWKIQPGIQVQVHFDHNNS